MIDKQQRIAELEARKAEVIRIWQYEACLLESEVREFAFTNRNMRLHGFDLKQFTLRHYVILDFNGNFFVKPTECEPQKLIDDTIDFLWLLNPNYSDDKEKLLEFDGKVKAKMNEVGLESFVEEVKDYLNKSLMDVVVKGEVDDKAPTISYVAGIIDTLACEYGWTDEHIMDLPWARLLQYTRSIEERKSKERGEKLHRLHNRYTTPLELEFADLDKELTKLREEPNAKPE
jgi:hypothetical protein